MKIEIQKEALVYISRVEAIYYRVVPVSVEGKTLTILTEVPKSNHSRRAISLLASLGGIDKVVVSERISKEEMDKLLREYYPVAEPN